MKSFEKIVKDKFNNNLDDIDNIIKLSIADIHIYIYTLKVLNR